MLKRSFHFIQLKKIRWKYRKGILCSQMLESEIRTSEKTTADFREGMQDNTALLTQYWFIQLLIQGPIAVPQTEIYICHIRRVILCCLEGKSGLGRASWLESLVCPQTAPKQAKWNKAVRTTLGGKNALNISFILLPFQWMAECPQSKSKTWWRVSNCPDTGTDVHSRALSHMVWWDWWDEHRASPWHPPTVKHESNCKRELESVLNNLVSNPSGCLVFCFFSFVF